MIIIRHQPFEGNGWRVGLVGGTPDIKKYNVNRTQADIYINPNLGSYGVKDFNAKAIKDMIRIGEETGKQYQPQLIELLSKVGKGS